MHRERLDYGGILKYESLIVTTMPHECLYLSIILWPWHIYDHFDFFFVRTYAIFGHNVAQNFALSYHEDTFFWIQAELI